MNQEDPRYFNGVPHVNPDDINFQNEIEPFDISALGPQLPPQSQNSFENSIENKNLNMDGINPQNNGEINMDIDNNNINNLGEQNPNPDLDDLNPQNKEDINMNLSNNNIIDLGDQIPDNISNIFNGPNEDEDNINYHEFSEGIYKQKEENEDQSIALDFEEFCTEKELKKCGIELSDSFINEQLLLDEIFSGPLKSQCSSDKGRLSLDNENSDFNEVKNIKLTSKESEKNPKKIFKIYKIKNSKNNKSSFFIDISEEQKSKEQAELNKNENLNINQSYEFKEKNKFEGEEIKIIDKKNKPLFSSKKSLEEKFNSKNSTNISSKIYNSSTKDSMTLNNSSNNRSNVLVGISSDISNLDNSNKFSSIDKDSKNNNLNNTMNNLNYIQIFKDKQKIFHISKETKLNKIFKDDIKLNIGEKDTINISGINLELKNESEIIQNSHISLPNKSFIFPMELDENKKPNINVFGEPIFNIPNKNNKKAKNSKDDELLKKKRNRVVDEIQTQIKKYQDLEKRIYREFREYLRKNEKYKEIKGVSEEFWEKYLNKDISKANIIIEGKKIKSYCHELIKYLFSIDDISKIYEEFLNDKKFHEDYMNNINEKNENIIIYKSTFEFYRKNMHKIYCDKYEESDLELDFKKFNTEKIVDLDLDEENN